MREGRTNIQEKKQTHMTHQELRHQYFLKLSPPLFIRLKLSKIVLKIFRKKCIVSLKEHLHIT